jgi:hypothetical protein
LSGEAGGQRPFNCNSFFIHAGVGCHWNDFFMRRRRALSSASRRCAGVRSDVFIDPSSCSSISEVSSSELSSSASSAGGVGRKYVADGGFCKFSSEAAMALSKVLKA